MENTKLHLILADDDMDDCDFFKEAMDELTDPCRLTVLNNGVALMDFLQTEAKNQPSLIFLDLNMPRKSGLDCMAEIQAMDTLSHIPVFIYSTSLDQTVINSLYQLGAYHYIQKPTDFAGIKSVIKKAISLMDNVILPPRSKEHFIIQP